MPRLDSFALPTLPGQDHMYPFGIIGSSTAARSHQAPLSKRNDNLAGSHLDAHRYMKRNTGRGAVLPPEKRKTPGLSTRPLP